MKTVKIHLNQSATFFLLASIVSSTLTPIAYAEKSQDPKILAETTAYMGTKNKLVRELLIELEIGKQYDLFFWNSVDIATGYGERTKFSAWLQKTLAQVAGWKYVELKYAARLEADFSEAELKELLELAKRPLIKKLLQSEIQAYEETGGIRARLLYKAWDDYNSSKIDIPQDLFKSQPRK